MTSLVPGLILLRLGAALRRLLDISTPSRLPARRAWSLARLLQLLSYLVVLAVFLGGGFLLFHRIFAYLISLESIGRPLLFRVVATGFLAFQAMLFLSCLVTSLPTLYQNPEIDFLLATPATGRQLFLYRLVQNVFYSSWATMLLGIPLLLALLSAVGAGPASILGALIMLFFFVLIPTLAAVCVIQVVVRLFPKITLKSLLAMLLLATAAAAWLFFALGQPASISIGQIDSLSQLNLYLSQLGATSHILLPSTWLAQLLLPPLQSGLGYLAARIWLIVITAVFILGLALHLGDRWYYASLMQRPAPALGRRRPAAVLSSFWGRRQPLVLKDALLFFRNPTQWAQAAIFLSLLVLYLGSLGRYPLLFALDQWRVIISIINFAFTGYILATLSVRFVFPAFSLEGPLFWLLRTVPLSPGKLFWQKAWPQILTSLVMAESLSLISHHLLKTPADLQVVSHLSLSGICLTVTIICLGLGAAWPDYRETNPSRIASGLGGMVAALISLIYVGISVAILARPAYLYSLRAANRSPGYGPELFFYLGLFLLISAATTIVGYRIGIKALYQRDV